MENSKKLSGSTWTNEQSSSVYTIERKYHKRIHLADVQGLKVDKKELKVQKCKEIEAILTSSQFKNYLDIH